MFCSDHSAAMGFSLDSYIGCLANGGDGFGDARLQMSVHLGTASKASCVTHDKRVCGCVRDYDRIVLAGSESYKCANRCKHCQDCGIVFDVQHWHRTGETMAEPCHCAIGRMDLADDVADDCGMQAEFGIC